jgi:hypothetical protein
MLTEGEFIGHVASKRDLALAISGDRADLLVLASGIAVAVWARQAG